MWFLLAYCHGVLVLYGRDVIDHPYWLILWFAPIPVLEYVFTGWFFRRRHPNEPAGSKSFRIAYAANMVVWVCFYLFWVVKGGAIMRGNPMVLYYGTWYFPMSLILWRSGGWFTGILLLLWAGAYGFFTVRRGLFRLVVSAGPFFVGPLVLLAFHWFFGGLGGIYWGDLADQPGVTRLYQASELADAVAKAPRAGQKVLFPPPELEKRAFLFPIRAARQSRDVWMSNDGKRLFLTFGGTYQNDCFYPAIVQKDTETGALNWVLTESLIRGADHSGDLIWAAPWHDPFFYGISPDDLSIRRVVWNGILLNRMLWQPWKVLLDRDGKTLYLATEVCPALYKYDLATGKLLKTLDLREGGYVDEGGVVSLVVQSRKTGRLYLAAGPGKNLLEVDPETFRVLRSLEFHDVYGTALLADDATGRVYYQYASLDRVAAVDMETFTVVRHYDGEFYSRKLIVDHERSALYVLGYVHGELFALDLDTGERLWEVNVGGRPTGMTPFEGDLLVHSMDGAFRLDLDTLWANTGGE